MENELERDGNSPCRQNLGGILLKVLSILFVTTSLYAAPVVRIFEEGDLKFVQLNSGSDTNVWRVEFSTDSGKTWTYIGDTTKGQEHFPCLFTSATFRATTSGNSILIGKVVAVETPKVKKKPAKPLSPKFKEQKPKRRIPPPPPMP